jgi:hypothetical protein
MEESPSNLLPASSVSFLAYSVTLKMVMICSYETSGSLHNATNQKTVSFINNTTVCNHSLILKLLINSVNCKLWEMYFTLSFSFLIKFWQGVRQYNKIHFDNLQDTLTFSDFLILWQQMAVIYSEHRQAVYKSSFAGVDGSLLNILDNSAL